MGLGEAMEAIAFNAVIFITFVCIQNEEFKATSHVTQSLCDNTHEFVHEE